MQPDGQDVDHQVVAVRLRQVEGLAVRWLVERRPSSTDRRAVQVGLTRKGRRLVDAVSRRFEADVTELLAQVPARDRRALTGAAGRLLVAHARTRGIELPEQT